MSALAYKHDCENPWGLDKPRLKRREREFHPVVVEIKPETTEQSGDFANTIANKYGFASDRLRVLDWSNTWIKTKSPLAFYGGGDAMPIASRYCILEDQSVPVVNWTPYYQVLIKSLSDGFLNPSGLESEPIIEALKSKERSLRLKKQFDELANTWYRETGMISMLHKKVMHPAYQRIIGMGKDALPLIFKELREKRGHWLWALCSITGEDPAAKFHKFSEAVNAWLEWGKENGYI